MNSINFIFGGYFLLCISYFYGGFIVFLSGNLVMLAGLFPLSKVNIYFKKARFFSLLMIAVVLVEHLFVALGLNNLFYYLITNRIIFLATVIDIPHLIINLYLVHSIVSGINEETQNQGIDIKATVEECWNYFLFNNFLLIIVLIIVSLLQTFKIIFPSSLLSYPLAFLLIISYIKFLHLLKEVSNKI